MPSATTKKYKEKIADLAKLTEEASFIDPELFKKYDVKRGLRDREGKGVLVGITNISEVNAFKDINGVRTPIEGELYYRGYDIRDIIKQIPDDKCFGFEACTYLLLFGRVPSKEELYEFCGILSDYRYLPQNFLRDIVMKKTGIDMMNMLSRSILMMYSYDDNADDTSKENVLRQCLSLIAKFPLLAVYGYNAYRYYHRNDSLIIHRPKPEYSTAENILYCLRADGKFTPLEAKILDIALILHMEHGGGNNSTFTTHLLSSSGTDTFSTVAAALGSLKGPKHGGANIKVIEMIRDIKKHVKKIDDEKSVEDYLRKIVEKKAFDKTGLIYGMGHAIYSLSDPRAKVFKHFVEQLAIEKGREKDYQLYSYIEKLAPAIISENRKIYKGVSPNVDFYSGFVYQMLGLPVKLFTPMFAVARISGWSAHRLEEICQHGKIMRPAYMTVTEHKKYNQEY